MRNLENLYRQVIMEHYRYPKNKGLVSNPNYRVIHLNNPSCGDEIKIQVNIEEDILSDIRHDGKGCSICCSSASVKSEVLKGKTIEDANRLLNSFLDMLKGEEIKDEEELEDAVVYQGVAQFPARIKCAALAWKALEKAILEK